MALEGMLNWQRAHLRPALILVSMLLLSSGNAHAQDWAALSADPELAQRFDYCALAQDPDAAPPDFEALIKAAQSAGETDRLAALVIADAGARVAREAKSKRKCERAFKAGEKLLSELERQEHQRLDAQAVVQASADPEIAEIQSAISHLWLRDQVARRVYLSLQKDASGGARWWARRRATANATLIDASATAYMRQLLERYDWIDHHRFGPKTSQFAWLLVQHADKHPEFQSMVLERMGAYLESDGVNKANYAYLWDRVAVNTGRLQRYGTQPIWDCHDGKLEPQPLEAPEEVDQRRAELGLDTMASGLAQMSETVCR